jgi:hypothetical protein
MKILQILLILLVFACESSLHAQRFVRMTTAEAAAKARAVVAARVVDVQVRQEAGNIYTFVTFQTTQVAKGDVPARFTYRRLGGRLGNVEIASGATLPEFTAGEEVVLFLAPEVSSDGYPTIFSQQVYRITTLRSGTRVVTPEPTGLSRSAAARPAADGGRMGLTEFFNALKQAQ